MLMLSFHFLMKMKSPKERGGLLEGCTLQELRLSTAEELRGPLLTVRKYSHGEDSARWLPQNSPSMQTGTHGIAPSFAHMSDIRKESISSPGELCRWYPTIHPNETKSSAVSLQQILSDRYLLA